MSLNATTATAATAAIVIEKPTECMICYELYNKSSRLPITCEFAECKYTMCITCVRAYLLTSVNEAHCMECNKIWSLDFLVILKKNWVNGAYQSHKKKLLVETEMSKMPQTMEAAALYKTITDEKRIQRDLLSRLFSVKTAASRLLRESEHEYKQAIQISHEEKGVDVSKEEKKNQAAFKKQKKKEWLERASEINNSEREDQKPIYTSCVKSVCRMVYAQHTTNIADVITAFNRAAMMDMRIGHHYIRHYQNIVKDNHRAQQTIENTIAAIDEFRLIAGSDYADTIALSLGVGVGVNGTAETAAAAANSAAAAVAEKLKEKKVFFMPCPGDECKGMLSTQYKCGLCSIVVCPDCHEIRSKGEAEEGEEDNKHTCDPNSVATARAIKKDTKQCPGCHAPIYRSEGCMQMWCTGCHTAFDWRSGEKIMEGQLHNPHFIEYTRKMNGGGAAPRAPGDVVCGGICAEFEVRRIITRIDTAKMPKETVEQWKIDLLNDKKRCIHKLLPLMYSRVSEVTRNTIRVLRLQIQHELDFETYRCKYLVNEITKDELADRVYERTQERFKSVQFLHVYELLSVVGIDMFNGFLLELENDRSLELTESIFTKMNEFDALRIHCNGLFARVGNAYNMSAPYINQKYKVHSIKYTIKQHKEGVAEKPGYKIIDGQ